MTRVSQKLSHRASRHCSRWSKGTCIGRWGRYSMTVRIRSSQGRTHNCEDSYREARAVFCVQKDRTYKHTLVRWNRSSLLHDLHRAEEEGERNKGEKNTAHKRLMSLCQLVGVAAGCVGVVGSPGNCRCNAVKLFPQDLLPFLSRGGTTLFLLLLCLSRRGVGAWLVTWSSECFERHPSQTVPDC